MNKELYNKLSVAAEYSDIVTNAAFKLEEKKNEPERIKKAYYDEHPIKQAGLLEFLYVIGMIGMIGGGGIASLIFMAGMASGEILAGFGMAIIPAIIGIVSLIVFIGSDKEEKRRLAEREKRCNEETATWVEKSTSEYNEMWNAFQEFVDKNIHVLNFLPEQYRDPQAISYMLVSVSSGRAETFKEAMNLYELQLHRWKVEDAAHQAAEAQEYAALAMQELNRQQAQTNASLKSIEYMQWYDYMDRKYRE